MEAHCVKFMVNSRVEPLSYMLLHGLVDISFEAYQELEHEHLDQPYNPDWEAYQRLEKEDRLRFFSLREGENLIGYASIVLDKDIHREGVMFGSFRDIFITKKKRGYAPFFVKFVEKCLCEMGVKRVYAADRLFSNNEAWRFYQAMGYDPQECVWGKTLH